MQVDTESSLSPQACLVYYGSIGFRVVLEEHVLRVVCVTNQAFLVGAMQIPQEP